VQRRVVVTDKDEETTGAKAAPKKKSKVQLSFKDDDV